MFLINFVFTFLLYLFGFFSGDFVSCDDLIKIVYNGMTIRHSPTLSSFRLYNSIHFFYNYVLNTQGSDFRFNIYKYLQLNGARFPNNHVYDHYHINLYLENMYNVHYNLSLTHQPYNLNLYLNEFTELSDINLYGQERIQYILNDLKIYDLEVLKKQNDTEKFKDFILKNNEKCIFQFKNMVNKK